METNSVTQHERHRVRLQQMQKFNTVVKLSSQDEMIQYIGNKECSGDAQVLNLAMDREVCNLSKVDIVIDAIHQRLLTIS